MDKLPMLPPEAPSMARLSLAEEQQLAFEADHKRPRRGFRPLRWLSPILRN